MTVLRRTDVFVLGIMGATAGKLTLWCDSSVHGADVSALGIMGAPAGKLRLWYGSSTGS